MTQVQIISTNLVLSTNVDALKPTNTTTTRVVHLTPWDLQFLSTGSSQAGLLFPKPRASITNVIDRLKASLARTLEIFPLLAGRLRMVKNEDDDTSSFFIECNNEGALFVHAIAHHVTANEIESPCVPQVLHSFFPFLVKCSYQGTSKPLFAVQVTELYDGLFIACTGNTLVLDASSFWLFFKAWTEIARGCDTISRPPIIDRWFPNDTSLPLRVPFRPDNSLEEKSYPPFEERYFHFTKENIGTLRAKANNEVGTAYISSLQALLAHVWRAVVRCRRIEGTQEVSYVLVVNDRKRLQPPLSENYFGGTVRCQRITTTANELLNLGLGWAAWQLKMVVLGQNDGVVRNFLRSWVENPNILVFKGNELITNGAPIYDCYDGDFGWGKPVLVRSGPEERSDGCIFLLPGSEEKSIDLGITLSPEVMAALVKDEEFMKAVTPRPRVMNIVGTPRASL